MANSHADLRKINIWRRVIFVLVALAVIIPCLLKPQLPGKPNHWAEEVYNRVENLKPGRGLLLRITATGLRQIELSDKLDELIWGDRAFFA